ncbi:MAG TPA: hypothetical protein VFV24_03440, partial [Candidatus Eisenbacteria bacterium]|nr:hypothetical protein [Candidatus Eisenbacteria bacterium]
MTRTCHLATPVAMLALVVALAPPSAYAISQRILIAPTGAAAFDGLGRSVSVAGDVNGDGYDDGIVAAGND